jgi:long-chain fatty acid transport protein
MSRWGWAGFLRAGAALGFLVIASAQAANAGGFAIREQSAYGQGSSFAGVAAGGALSSMFWNPATMTQVPGIQFENDLTGVFPFASNTPLPGSALIGFGGTNNTGSAGLVPSGYGSYQVTPDLWLGVSINAPFGLSTNFPDPWAGRPYAGSTTLRTYNAAPSFAYRFNDWISVGAGAQIQYASADLRFGLGPTPGAFLDIDGNGLGYGATAGITLTPTPTTSIGLGWRSGIDQKIDATLRTTTGLPPTPPAPLSTPGAVNTTVKAPDTVSLGIRQRLDPRWTVMGTAEWSNWSRIGNVTFLQPSGAPATLLGVPVALPLQYRDGWFFSLGAEYMWNERLTLRTGIGYEISPITDRVRMPLIPDNNRIWASVGASWQVSKFMHFDLAYSHIWVQDPSINITAGSGNPWFNPGIPALGIPPLPYVGSVNAHVDILSAAVVVRFDALEPDARRPFLKY